MHCVIRECLAPKPSAVEGGSTNVCILSISGAFRNIFGINCSTDDHRCKRVTRKILRRSEEEGLCCTCSRRRQARQRIEGIERYTKMEPRETNHHRDKKCPTPSRILHQFSRQPSAVAMWCSNVVIKKSTSQRETRTSQGRHVYFDMTWQLSTYIHLYLSLVLYSLKSKVAKRHLTYSSLSCSSLRCFIYDLFSINPAQEIECTHNYLPMFITTLVQSYLHSGLNSDAFVNNTMVR